VTLPGAELSFYFAAAAQLEPALVPRSQSASSDARRSGARRRRPCSPPSTHRAVGPAEGDRAAAIVLASRYAAFRAGIETDLIGGAAASSAKRELSLCVPRTSMLPEVTAWARQIADAAPICTEEVPGCRLLVGTFFPVRILSLAADDLFLAATVRAQSSFLIIAVQPVGVSGVVVDKCDARRRLLDSTGSASRI
jgi:hypothetical protein